MSEFIHSPIPKKKINAHFYREKKNARLKFKKKRFVLRSRFFVMILSYKKNLKAEDFFFFRYSKANFPERI